MIKTDESRTCLKCLKSFKHKLPKKDWDIQKAAITDFYKTWEKHPIFAVRPVWGAWDIEDESVAVAYSACDVFNKHSGNIDARVEFCPTGVYIVDPMEMDGRIDDHSPKCFLQELDYGDPNLHDSIRAALGHIAASRVERC